MTGKSLHCLRKKDLSIVGPDKYFFTKPVSFPVNTNMLLLFSEIPECVQRLC
jgi:hypothetical protein